MTNQISSGALQRAGTEATTALSNLSSPSSLPGIYETGEVEASTGWNRGDRRADAPRVIDGRLGNWWTVEEPGGDELVSAEIGSVQRLSGGSDVAGHLVCRSCAFRGEGGNPAPHLRQSSGPL